MTTSSSPRRLAITLAGSALGVTLVAGLQTPGTFTASQADLGRAVYQASCAGCHLADLAGRNEAPQL